MLRKLSYNFLIGIDAISQNKLRAILTSLGIIFGVASVIAMLAIGRGAELAVLEQMEALGVNNLIINPVVEQEEGEVEEEEDDRQPVRFTPGLTMMDVLSMEELPHIDHVSPEIVMDVLAVREGRKRSTKLVGVRNSYFGDLGFELQSGNKFSKEQLKRGYPVCIIGNDIKVKFFPTEEAVGKQIKCGKNWLTIVGVLGGRNISKNIRDELGIRNYDLDIYIPVQTMLLRYKNRSLVTRTALTRAQWDNNDDDEDAPPKNYHQLDKLVIRVKDTRYMHQIAEISHRMLYRRHNNVVDYEIIVPELLLQQKRETTRRFNFVLGAIASISLLVGGIGIMNIMLASVLERIKEIGLRLSLGATKQDIVYQFMGEAVAISITGGILGIFLGVSFSFIINQFTDTEAIVSGWSIFLSFFVALIVGLIFGIYPAQKAAIQDPVVSLRSN
ncbi:MAG: ABC transporter permease [Bacteroidia bacterium]|nr:ABC transporter permease [Bacteroidia bacterium]